MVDPDLVDQIARVYRLPTYLLAAQIQVESGGDPNAFRYEPAYFEKYIFERDVKGARYGPLAACSYGLLQILLETALEIGFTDKPEMLFVPRIGLSWGAKYLRLLWDNVGGQPETYRKALVRYNGRGAAAEAYADRVYAVADRQLKV